MNFKENIKFDVLNSFSGLKKKKKGRMVVSEGQFKWKLFLIFTKIQLHTEMRFYHWKTGKTKVLKIIESGRLIWGTNNCELYMSENNIYIYKCLEYCKNWYVY